jgi:hypothetical protein
MNATLIRPSSRRLSCGATFAVLTRCIGATVALVVAASPARGENAGTQRTAPAAGGDASAPVAVSVEKIWDAAPHNAFTALIQFQGRLVCAFREGPNHREGNRESHIRVLASKDGGKAWEPVAVLEDPRGDIRDAKMAVLPGGQLLLLTAIKLYEPTAERTYQSIAYRSRDGKTWEGPIDVGQPNVWLWGIKWHKDAGYSIGYGTAGLKFARLYRTYDGVKYEPIVEKIDVADAYPNESAIAFGPDDRAYALLRCDPAPAFVGTAGPPYTAWTWKQSKTRVGGPALTFTPDGRLLGGGRLHDGKVRTSLFWVDPKSAEIGECLALPSGGDTSYPGLAWDSSGLLNVSYYASHEDKKAKIFFAKVRVPGPASAAGTP